jgi:hypothetical protein
MIPFCNGNAILTSILGQNTAAQSANDDLAWHLANKPAATPDPWALRLLPAFVRTPLKARIAARQYEATLIAMWENSPHLLDDIGVVLSTEGNLPEHLAAAPARVIEHVKASIHEQAAAAQPQPDLTLTTQTRMPTAPIQVRTPQDAMPAGLPA